MVGKEIKTEIISDKKPIVLKFLRQAIHVTTYIFKLRLNILISISLKK